MPGGADAWALYQCSTGAPIADVLADRDGPLLVDYHNITPARLFEAWEPRIARELDEGERRSSGSASVRCSASRTRRSTRLSSTGWATSATAVAPVLVDVQAFDRKVDRRALDALTAQKRGSEWLFVGRVAPNKAQHDVLRAFALVSPLLRPARDAVARRGVVVAALLAALRETIDALGPRAMP